MPSVVAAVQRVRRRGRFVLSLLLLLTLFTGCGRRDPRVEQGVRTGTLHVNAGAEPRDFDPQTTTLPADGVVIRSLMEGLAESDPADCHPIPAVASKWEVSADGLTWTFHLRREARWSNGDAVTAHDFVFAYRRVLSPALAAEYRDQFFCLQNAREFSMGTVTDFGAVGVRAADDHTLVLTLIDPVPYLPTLLTQTCWFPLHRATIEAFGRSDQRATAWTRPGNHVGNGAFILKEWKPGQVVRVAKSATYWDRERVQLKEVLFYPIENPAVGDAAFRAGQLHTTMIPIDKAGAYKRDPKMAPLLYESALLQTAFLRLNCSRAPLDDVRVRRALSLAIDREQLARHVVQCEQPAFSLTPPNCFGYTAGVGTTTDVSTARRLLGEAGFPDGKGFPPLELPFYVFHGTEQPVVETIQQMWRTNLGISVALVKQEMKTVISARRTGDFHILNSSWIGDYLDPTTFLDLLRTNVSNNGTRWSNREYDALLDQASRIQDSATRFDLLRRAEALMLAESPVIPLYYHPSRTLRHAAVKGWYDNLLDLHPLKFVRLEK
jgi:oligopeptide transport system substrate-binding protein